MGEEVSLHYFLLLASRVLSSCKLHFCGRQELLEFFVQLKHAVARSPIEIVDIMASCMVWKGLYATFFEKLWEDFVFHPLLSHIAELHIAHSKGFLLCFGYI